ncbi:MAG: group I truncated hemoglobin [Gemmatimonadota bacterium]
MHSGPRWFWLPTILVIAISAGCQPGDDGTDEGIEPDTMAVEDTLAAAAEGSLYDRLGGEPAIASVVDSMVAYATADTELNFTRQGTTNEWEATPENIALLKTRLVQFVGQATGGTQVYEGQDMATVHRGMAITDEEFDRLGGHLQHALDVHDVPAREQDELMAIVETTRTAIVAAPGASASEEPATVESATAVEPASP